MMMVKVMLVATVIVGMLAAIAGLMKLIGDAADKPKKAYQCTEHDLAMEQILCMKHQAVGGKENKNV